MLRRSRGKYSSSDEDFMEESEWLPNKQSKPKKKRGRVPEEMKWTRVLKFDYLMDDFPTLYPIPKDLKKFIECENYSTYDEQNDNEQEEQSGMIEAESQSISRRTQLNRRFEQRGIRKRNIQPVFTPEISYDRKLLKTRQLCKLSSQEKLNIVYKVIVEDFSQKDVATLYRVKASLVQYLTKKALKDNKFLSELRSRDDKKQKRQDLIVQATKRIYQKVGIINKAEDVINEIKQEDDVDITNSEVRQVMKDELNLQYRPIKRIAFQANSTRALILRQMYAKSLIDQLLRGKTVLNCDETWLNLKNYTRRCWRLRGVANSSNIQTMSPRIALISAIDNKGACYFSLTQVNTDSEVKSMFLQYLAYTLDLERPDWRSDTIILMDNAPYNKSDETMNLIKNLSLPVMFSAAYSYDAASVERHFGYLKQNVILQPDQAAGKCIRGNSKAQKDEKIIQCLVLARFMPRANGIFVFQTTVSIKVANKQMKHCKAQANIVCNLKIIYQ